MNKVLKSINNLEKKLLSLINDGETVLEACESEFSTFNELNNVLQEDILKATLEMDLPPQYYRENQFGHFNVTFIQNQFFNIQVYIMNDIDTEIHDHGFAGAFQLLSGKTIHNTFTFEESKKLEEGVIEGRLVEDKVKPFSPGDYSIITKSIIHQILRLAKENITLIVTDFSHEQPNSMNGYYLPPHLHVKNLDLTRNFKRKISALNQLFTVDQNVFEVEFRKFLTACNLFEVLIMLTRLNIYQMGLEYNKSFQQKSLELALEELKSRKKEHYFLDYKNYLISQKRKLEFIK